MKFLQLCKKCPYPLKDGESIAVTYLAKALHDLGCEVSLLSMNTTKHWVEVDTIRDQLAHYKQTEFVPLDNQVKPLHAFLNLFSSDSYNISRFDCDDFAEKLKDLLERNSYDVVQLESLYLAPYIELIRTHSDAAVVLRAHNVEHEIWERMAANENSMVRRWYLDYSARKLKKYEEDQLLLIDRLLPISCVDEAKFRKLGYTGVSTTLPIGIDLQEISAQQIDSSKDLSISFIGSLDWMPNIEALNWFLDQVWTHLLLIFPKLELHVAGRNCPEWLLNLQTRNVTVHGEVNDARAFLLAHPISVVPLLSGSGMRAKIVEAMALGRVVISTEVGLEGIAAQDDLNVLVANSEKQFIEKFRICYQDRNRLPQIGAAARAFAEAHYDHRTIAQQYLNSWQTA